MISIIKFKNYEQEIITDYQNTTKEQYKQVLDLLQTYKDKDQEDHQYILFNIIHSNTLYETKNMAQEWIYIEDNISVTKRDKLFSIAIKEVKQELKKIGWKIMPYTTDPRDTHFLTDEEETKEYYKRHKYIDSITLKFPKGTLYKDVQDIIQIEKRTTL